MSTSINTLQKIKLGPAVYLDASGNSVGPATNVSFVSSDNGVISIEPVADGIAYAVANVPGTASVTVTADNLTAVISINVSSAPASSLSVPVAEPENK
jgi:hypothetical protein